MSTEKIVKSEVRFSWHLPKNDYRPDLHYIREDVTYADGFVKPNIRLVKDYERPVWVTTQAFRDHKDKKEYEYIDRLNIIRTTQSDMTSSVAKLLGQGHLANNPKAVKDSPYVYGLDVTSTSLIKLASLKRNNYTHSPSTVATFDIETQIGHNGEILMATIAMKGKTHTAIMKSFLPGIPDPEARIKKAFKYYLPQYEDLDTMFSFHDDEISMLRHIFRIANEWAPVFLAIWNMDFDIPKVLERIKAKNGNQAEIICDPNIPAYARTCRYRQGPSKKTTQSGKVTPIHPALRWHTLTASSTFYVIDAMCVYRQLRMADAALPSYSLDYVLTNVLGTGKLNFKEADGYGGAKWHTFMQEKYPIEYIVYNIYDCLSMLELEQKTGDLSKSLPFFAEITDFQKFNSQVRKVTDAAFLFGLEHNRVIGTVGNVDYDEAEEVELPEEEDLLDESGEYDPEKFKTLDLRDWIQLLPQNQLLKGGLKCLEDYPDVVTNVRGITCDLDATSSYPSCTLVGNVSKETCVDELIEIEGIRENVFREQNLSICLGGVNTLEYFNKMFSLPTLEEVDKLLEEM